MISTRILTKLLIFLFFISCEIETISIEDKPITKPLFSKSKRTNFSENNDKKIIEEKIGKESNFYFENTLGTYFLLSYYPNYYEEVLATSWSEDGNYIMFFINKSNRYKSKNRLVLFKLNSEIPKVLVDEKTAKIETFRFEQSKFLYQLDDGTEIIVRLI